MKFFYDLHIHSCLSPCAGDDMTPHSIAGMAKLNGLQLVALTDHNSCANCPAFFAACAEFDVVPVAGMELTTAEDIHLVCLLPDLDSALAFGAEVEKRRVRIANRPEIFGHQHLCAADDTIVSEEEHLLPNATQLSLSQAFSLGELFGAAVYPAHIDRAANGIIAALGVFPDTPAFTAAEFHSRDSEPGLRRENPALEGLRGVFSSDAHELWDIAEAENDIELPECSAAALVNRLRGEG